MAGILPALDASSHRNRLDGVRPVMAKAVNKIETRQIVEWKEAVGRAVQRCFLLAGVSQKEAAALLSRDTAQIARWVAGTERPQFDAIFGVDAFRSPLVIALAELAGEGIEVITEIRVRRRA